MNTFIGFAGSSRFSPDIEMARTMGRRGFLRRDFAYAADMHASIAILWYQPIFSGSSSAVTVLPITSVSENYETATQSERDKGPVPLLQARLEEEAVSDLDGQKLRSKTKRPSLAERIISAGNKVPDKEWDKVPPDLARNFRRYKYHPTNDHQE